MSTNSTMHSTTPALPLTDGTSRRCPACSADALDNFHVAFGRATNPAAQQHDTRRNRDFLVVADCTACGLPVEVTAR